MTKIYLVRHAEAEGNLYRIAHGHYNGLITDWRGPKQIRALAQRFEGIRVDAVYSSDLYRTQTTAQAIYVPKHLPLHTSPAFREVHMGAWEGHTWQEVSRLWPEEFYHFNRRIDLWQPEGGENARQVLERYLPALEEVARAHDGETIALFSHGAALRIVLGTLQGLTLRELGTSPHGDNTAVSLLEYENGRFRVVFRDDNSHLTGSDELSIFAKQTWWKNEDAVEQGTEFAPMPDALRAQLGVPRPGEATLIRLGSEPHRGRRRLGRLVLARARVARQALRHPPDGAARAALSRVGTSLPAPALRRSLPAPVFRAARLLRRGGRRDGKGHPRAHPADYYCLIARRHLTRPVLFCKIEIISLAVSREETRWI